MNGEMAAIGSQTRDPGRRGAAELGLGPRGSGAGR